MKKYIPKQDKQRRNGSPHRAKRIDKRKLREKLIAHNFKQEKQYG